MTREIRLHELDEILEGQSYPLSITDARAQFDDIRLVYADGEEPFVDVLDRIDAERFDSPDELQSSIFNTVPVEGVGEPGQSEGEG